MEIFVSHLVESNYILPIIKRYNLGIETVNFASSYALDNINTSIEAYKLDLFKYGVSNNKLSFHGPFMDLAPASHDELIVEVTRKRMKQAYIAAKEFHASKLSFHTGYVPRTYMKEEWTRSSIEYWKDFTKDKLSDIQILIENVYEDSYDAIKSIVDELEHPNFKACLDIGHLNVSSKIPIEDWIKALNTRIGHVHIHNNDGVNDYHYGLTNGNIDMEKTLAQLKEYCPEASWTLEVVNNEQIIESIEYMVKLNYI